MKIMTIQVPDDSVEFVEEFVERIGGYVEEKVEEKKEKPIQKSKEKKSKEKIDHTYLFGKWKDFDIDARKLREDAWRRK